MRTFLLVTLQTRSDYPMNGRCTNVND